MYYGPGSVPSKLPLITLFIVVYNSVVHRPWPIYACWYWFTSQGN